MANGMIVVSERIIIEADKMANEANNSFERVLKIGLEYKDAGLTPIYLLDPEFMDLYVYCEETFQKKLN